MLYGIDNVTLRSVANEVGIVFTDEMYDFYKSLYIAIDDTKDLKQLVFMIYHTYVNLTKTKADTHLIELIGINDDNQIPIAVVISDYVDLIIESITDRIKREGFEITQRIDVSANVNRDEDGNFISLSSQDNSDESKSKEIAICFALNTRNGPKHIIKFISETLSMSFVYRKSLNSIIKKVDEAVYSINHMPLEDEIKSEMQEFLEWMKNSNFIFLAYTEHYISDGKFYRDQESSLGMMTIDSEYTDDELKHPSIEFPIYITRSQNISGIYKCVNMDMVIIREFGEDGEFKKEIRFLGLFSHDINFHNVRTIPIVKIKVDKVLRSFGFERGPYSTSFLISILQDFPRVELLQLSEEQLLESCKAIISLSIKPRNKLFVYKDPIGFFMRCILYIPREAFGSEYWNNMQQVLSKSYSGTILNEQVRYHSSLARLQLIMKVNDINEDVDISDLEQQAKQIFSCWSENLHSIVLDELTRSEADDLWHTYGNIFSSRYQKTFDEKTAFKDLLNVKKAVSQNSIVVDLGSSGEVYSLRIYIPFEGFYVSKMLPAIENMAMDVAYHYTYRMTLKDGKIVWMHNFILDDSMVCLELLDIKDQFELTLLEVLSGNIDDDYYNSLVALSGINFREVNLLRALGGYLKQVKFEYFGDAISTALAAHPEAVTSIVKLFHIRFNPEVVIKKVDVDHQDRQHKSSIIISKIKKILMNITDLSHDKIVNGFMCLILAMVRTNFYIKRNSKDASMISFKFDCKKIPFLPSPKPFFEIYVFAHEFEAVHLRGGMVSRGGLRWSNRFQDFRTEVLGLMKAQMPKNAVIIPTGAKGGFIVKAESKRTPDKAVQCYKDVLRCMLDITDNRLESNKSISVDLIKYDGEDSYLVVAADKGTARFSDSANLVSKEYNFWLGDAFASGGSSGYDHKAMGITARGAWVAVERHFWEIGVSIKNQPFTVVGIGDMSGDVFGNGMLLSKQIKLIAAFNHMHIFIDPEPDPATSFVERKRLFDLPSSSWCDYNPELISKGGGVFDLKTKSIAISEEMKEIFDIESDEISPKEFIKYILKARVDLIWNGGIGTYVKAKFESHDVVADRENNEVRVDGQDIRAKMFVEGGNLGCTQFGRIEYAQNGGRINTDFLDNSAGVSCSDMEVNIKIALDAALLDNKITHKDRNSALLDMTDEVANIILRRCNQLQIKSVSVAYLQSCAENASDKYRRLIRIMEDYGILKRELECLPSDVDIAKMRIERKNFQRPEIAVITAYSKMLLYDKILNSELLDNEYFNKYLIQYFPKYLRDNFANYITAHPLRREIIANYITNSVVNRMGPLFVQDLSENTGWPFHEVVRVYMTIRDAYCLRELWSKIDALDSVELQTYVKIVTAVHVFVEKASSWLLRNYPKPINIDLAVSEFSSDIMRISENLEFVLDNTALSQYKSALVKYDSPGIPKELSFQIAKLSFLSSSLAITSIANDIRFHLKIQVDILTVAKIYFYIGESLHLKWLRSVGNKLIQSGSYWHKISVRSIIDEVYDQQMNITSDVVKYMRNNHSYKEAIDLWSRANQESLSSYNTLLNELKSCDGFDLSKLLIIIKRLSVIA